MLYSYVTAESGQEELPYSDFLDKAKTEQVDSLTIKEGQITGRYVGAAADSIRKAAGDKELSTGKLTFYTYVPPEENVVDRLKDTDISYKSEEPAGDNIWLWSLLFVAPVVLFGYIILKSMKNAGSGLMSMNKSLVEKIENVETTFDDVAGVDSAKKDLQEIIEFLDNPQKFSRVGARIPRGVLMEGPPGTGKTLMAKALAGEAGVPFFSVSGSDFVEMFVGRGAARVRDMFDTVKKESPCILFIDEIDAIGGARGSGGFRGGSNDERDQTLNQILAEMDGMDGRDDVIIVAATNRADILDKALTRPGRFDRKVTVGLPDVRGRKKILQVHADKKGKLAGGGISAFNIFAEDVDWDIVARSTVGFSGAELENLLNEAAIFAARRDSDTIGQRDIEDARDKIIMGPKNTTIVSDTRKELVAWHEAAHTVVSYALRDHAMPIHKVTLIPRGRTAGALFQLPKEDEISTRAHLKAMMAVAMAGRVGEELLYSEDSDMISAGAQGDIQHATVIAEKMVTEWGMSEALSMRNYRNEQDMTLSPLRAFGASAGDLVDKEVDRLLEEAHDRARDILEDYKDQHQALVEALYEYETLDAEDVKTIMTGGSLDRPALGKAPTQNAVNENKRGRNRPGPSAAPGAA